MAIARLLLKDPAVVILDEATSHLDNDNEHHVQAALDAALFGRTAIVIAHRLSTIRHADRIAVSTDGRIVELGTHDELLALDGRYAAQLRAGDSVPVIVDRWRRDRACPSRTSACIDLSTVIAGPNCARYLADFGADVIKVERPDGDSLRTMAWRDARDGEGLVVQARQPQQAHHRPRPQGRRRPRPPARARRRRRVLVENFRPGTLERLGLGPDVLHARNPRLVITRVSGFGQDGPYAERPGFATIAEAMCGFAAINGEPDGQPLLPPMALTDEVTGLAAAFATMVAVHSGRGQVVDVNLLETMFHLMGPLPSVYALTGTLQPRLGAGLPYTVPRGTYRCADGRWIAVSTSSNSIAAAGDGAARARRRPALRDVRRAGGGTATSWRP